MDGRREQRKIVVVVGTHIKEEELTIDDASHFLTPTHRDTLGPASVLDVDHLARGASFRAGHLDRAAIFAQDEVALLQLLDRHVLGGGGVVVVSRGGRRLHHHGADGVAVSGVRAVDGVGRDEHARDGGAVAAPDVPRLPKDLLLQTIERATERRLVVEVHRAQLVVGGANRNARTRLLLLVGAIALGAGRMERSARARAAVGRAVRRRRRRGGGLGQALALAVELLDFVLDVLRQVKTGEVGGLLATVTVCERGRQTETKRKTQKEGNRGV